MNTLEFQVVSTFFTGVNKVINEPDTNISDTCLDLIDELNYELTNFKVPPPVDCIYNSTEYARDTFEMYIRKYCGTKKPIMYFGMNPGPWGMSQTGVRSHANFIQSSRVPFGEVNAVRDWLGIEGPVGKPPKEISARPIKGFNCTRSEISGKRFWGLFKDICGTPEVFFKSSFVYNYLPQQWMKANGCNVTPSDFKVSEMQDLYDICDPIFCKVLELYDVEIVVAIGKFCENRAAKALKNFLTSRHIKILYLPHPSPRTVNNNNWNAKALEHLKQLGLLKYYQSDTHSVDLP